MLAAILDRMVAAILGSGKDALWAAVAVGLVLQALRHAWNARVASQRIQVLEDGMKAVKEGVRRVEKRLRRSRRVDSERYAQLDEKLDRLIDSAGIPTRVSD